LPGARIAAGLGFHFQQQKVVDPGLGQSPCRRQAGDAAADDQNAGFSGFGRRRKTAITQAMAERV
jgi:hypothetical protein